MRRLDGITDSMEMNLSKIRATESLELLFRCSLDGENRQMLSPELLTALGWLGTGA